ncbi:TPA: hypothetical protein DIC38_02490 [Candidatus Nomurabacteria bacterium]|nr:MAG: hypothetical protein O210_OD1C00001G0233 [Parcubacteria bacterium RAAC4_OD1_1]HCY26523.1 hypothetical protein [Candidatus Nomurabacteria bacterium]
MEFIYDKKIDEKCQEKINACELIFDQEKKTGIFPVDNEIIGKFELVWTPEVEKFFISRMSEIFKADLPKNFKCFLNSTPYSMDIEEGISISASTQTPIRTICHETNHFMFRKSIYKDKYFPKTEIEEAKEIFTIINNIYFQEIMENQDMGWKKFWKERFNFLKIWIKDNK